VYYKFYLYLCKAIISRPFNSSQISIMKPYDVNDVADYIIMSLNSDESFSLINLKLQKLVYYVQAWCLGIQSVPFMSGRFEAWVHGPVCRPLYDRFKDSKSLYAYIGVEDVRNRNAKAIFEQEDVEFMDYILENYARFSGTQLEAMTHSEKPWIDARKGAAPMDKCENEITQDSMREFYGKKYSEIPN